MKSGAGCPGTAGPGDKGPGARGKGATAGSQNQKKVWELEVKVVDQWIAGTSAAGVFTTASIFHLNLRKL